MELDCAAMSSNPIPAATMFHNPAPSLAQLPHLITALDTRFMNALVGINGAKLGVWRLAAPFDENDCFAPYREGVPLNAWSMAYNQGELLACRNIISHESIMIVDCNADEKVLAKAEETRTVQDDTVLGYHDHAELPGILAKIGWAIIPVGENQDQVIFVASPGKRDVAELLKKWCHGHGRCFSMLNGDVINVYPAPDETRTRLIFEEGAEFLNKLAHFGIKGDEVQACLPRLLAMIKESGEQQQQQQQQQQ